MKYPNSPTRLAQLDASIKFAKTCHRLGKVTDEELADFADLIEELRMTPPRDWPEGVSMDEAIDMLAEEYRESERRKQAVARKQSDLLEKARERRATSV